MHLVKCQYDVLSPQDYLILSPRANSFQTINNNTAWALKELTLLYEENNTIDLIDQIDLDALLRGVDPPSYNPATMFKKASTKFPPPAPILT